MIPTVHGGSGLGEKIPGHKFIMDCCSCSRPEYEVNKNINTSSCSLVGNSTAQECQQH